jgi:hypothetical protein
MTVEELTPEAVAILESLINNPHPLPDGPVLQLLMAERLVKGSPHKVYATSQGLQILAEYIVTHHH